MRWRRCGALALSACCLPVALLRLLLLAGGSTTSRQRRSDAAEPVYSVAGEEAPGAPRGHLYFAGAYMAETSPGNVSHCRWQYDLPTKLAYLEQELIGSPESPAGRPYRVLPFVVRGLSQAPLAQLTLCTHATADQVYNVVELARRWEGPVSLAVFVPARDAGIAVRMLDRACRCEPAMIKVSVHLIFPRDMPPELTPPLSIVHQSSITADCSASDLQVDSANVTERRRWNVAYPINVARNVARTLAPTQCILVSDVELLPSEKLASRFLAMLKGRSPKRAIAFVLPTFEIEAGEPLPKNKKELLVALRAGLAVYFHRFSCSHCQRFPGLTRWILRPDPGRVRPLIITRREYPHHRWEPIFIGTKHDPLYTEEMSWEGRQDKMTQMFEMCLMNYRLIILDGAFLVHTPGIKRRSLADEEQQQQQHSMDERQRAYERQNARIYQRVTRRLLKQYPVNHRCRP
ncbi:beta-1,4-glucuronyltransferase 1-like [Phymastichus coffea]|uniref:beta-1,4-glucuronyltransferase 1-like n=1 Tax=Phymastichus coffea TaxID=108790 RepID=UPI00273BDA42|nr:beta-1,4-glucuronyltransferase 1-like [Phymastichus coffea]